MAATLFEVLLPVFGVILTGFFLKSLSPERTSFWRGAEDLTYHLLFPALLIARISVAPKVGTEALPFAAALVTATLAAFTVLYVCQKMLSLAGPDFGSLVQGVLRFNTYIGLSILLPLYGPPAMTQAAVLMAVLIPLVNVVSVTVLIAYGGKPSGRSSLVASLYRNPVLIGCLIGLILNLLQAPPPHVVLSFLEILGRSALPMGLLTVGASLELAALRSRLAATMATTVARLCLMPLLTWACCLLFAVPQEAMRVAILFAGLPGSALSVILARQLGGNSILMAGITTAQTLASLATLPLLLAITV